MTRGHLDAGTAIIAASLNLELEPVDAGQVVSGAPQTGSAIIALRDGVEVGAWEMTAGEMRDVEADEVFTVLFGDGTVVFEDGRRLELTAGVTATLRDGERTVWTVLRTLRKVYWVDA